MINIPKYLALELEFCRDGDRCDAFKEQYMFTFTTDKIGLCNNSKGKTIDKVSRLSWKADIKSPPPPTIVSRGYNDCHFPIDTSLFNSCASDFMSI